jgi:hypothetical protein
MHARFRSAGTSAIVSKFILGYFLPVVNESRGSAIFAQSEQRAQRDTEIYLKKFSVGSAFSV